MVRTRILPTVILAAIHLVTSTEADSGSRIFARQAGTCLTDFVKCANPGLPSNFCCPAKTKCITLAADTTVLCCPEGSNCDTIAPIVCNISLQDASIRPNATLKTTALSAKLPTCRDKCCPHGYSCDAQNLCTKNADQNVAPVGLSTSTTSSATISSTGSVTAPTITTASTTFSFPSTTSAPNVTPPPAVQSCPAFPTTAILIFFFAGLLTGVALVFLVLCIYGICQRRRARKHELERRKIEDGIGAISSPRLQDDSSIGRIDFLRKNPSTPSTLVEPRDALGRQRTIRRVKSFFSRGGEMTEKEYEIGDDRNAVPVVPPLRVNKQTGNLQAQRRLDPPVTPPQQTYTQYGDIYIGTDDGIATVSSSSRSEIPEVLRSGFTPSPLAQNQKGNKAGLGINRGSGLGVGGSAIPESENKRSPNGGGKDATSLGIRELLPPPKFLGDNRGSEITTFSKIIEKSGVEVSVEEVNAKNNRNSARKRGHERNPSGGVGIAGLNPGMPYIYKGSPQSFTKS